jgi:hypothetical protein
MTGSISAADIPSFELQAYQRCKVTRPGARGPVFTNGSESLLLTVHP